MLQQFHDNYPNVIPLIYKGQVSSHYTERAIFYGVGGIPDSFVNGSINTGSLSYASLEFYYNDIQNQESPLDIQLSYTSHPETGFELNADVDVTGNITTTENEIFFVITDYYDYEYFSLERRLEQQDFNLNGIGSSEIFTQQMEIDPNWTFNSIIAVVFVQTLSGDKRILQVVKIPIELNAEVDGIVVDAFTQQPIANALIRCGSFTDYTNANGEYSMELIAGDYNLYCTAENYEDITGTFTVNVGEVTTINIELNERLLPPNNLVAEWIGSDVELSWNSPGVYTGFTEDFESGELPEGWLSISNEDEGWFFTNEGSSSGFTIPDHTFYAVSNDDGNNDDSSMDYLILPPQDFSRLFEVEINFQSYFTGLYDHAATLEYSLDEGANWGIVAEIPEDNSWLQLTLTLQDVCGEGFENVWLAFHADDGGSWASGWAIDDVVLGEGGTTRDFTGYNLYEVGNPNSLNSGLITETNYQLSNVNQEDHTYFATAVYTSGESEASNYFLLNYTGSEELLASAMLNLSNYPNPFNPSTTIEYSLKEPCNICLEIYNIRGRKVRILINEFKCTGYYNVIWQGTDDNGKNVTSGIYFYQMKTRDYSIVKKMILLR